MARSDKTRHYICYIRATNTIILASTMKEIARNIGINPKTISRHFETSPKYITDDWIIWNNIIAVKSKRGFVYRKRS